MSHSSTHLQKIVKISVLASLAFIIMLWEIPLPFAPPFYKLDFSEVIVLIGGFSLGPLAAVAIEALKIILYLLFRSSITMGVGELANFFVGVMFVVPACYFYQKNKSKKHALVGLMIGSTLMSITACLINYFVLIPAYAFFMEIPINALVDMGTSVNSSINSLLSLVVLATLPFNIVKAILVSLIVFISYKKISIIIKK